MKTWGITNVWLYDMVIADYVDTIDKVTRHLVKIVSVFACWFRGITDTYQNNVATSRLGNLRL